MITQITKACLRAYSDTGQTTAYVEWRDQLGRTGRTEGCAKRKNSCFLLRPSSFELGTHMQALFARAEREGVPITAERR